MDALLRFSLLIARILLSGVFATAGTAKLWDRGGLRRAISDFGVPARLVGPIAKALPFIELVVAFALLPARFAFWSGIAAFVLLCGFTAIIAANLWRGRNPMCRCFGQMRAHPIGPRTLARNGGLSLCAAIVAWSGRSTAAPSLTVYLAHASPVFIGLTAVLAILAVQSWFIVHLMRQHGRLLVRLEVLEASVGLESAVVPAYHRSAADLEVGAQAPVFTVRSSTGEPVTLDVLWAEQTALLIFSNPECGPCAALLPRIGEWQAAHAGRKRIAVISSGSPDEVRRQTQELRLHDLFIQDGTIVADAYGADGTPAGVLIHPGGTVGSRVVFGADAIEELLTAASTDTAPVREAIPESLGTAPISAS